jgi:hypothetical protein
LAKVENDASFENQQILFERKMKLKPAVVGGGGGG